MINEFVRFCPLPLAWRNEGKPRVFGSFASPVAGKKAKMLRVGFRFVIDLGSSLFSVE